MLHTPKVLGSSLYLQTGPCFLTSRRCPRVTERPAFQPALPRKVRVRGTDQHYGRLLSAHRQVLAHRHQEDIHRLREATGVNRCANLLSISAVICERDHSYTRFKYVGRGSSVGIATRYGLDGQGFEHRSEWPNGLSRGSAADRLLGLRVRISSGARMFVLCVVSTDKRQNAGQ